MKNKGVAKAGILNEIVSLDVKLERNTWREQKTRIKVTGHESLEAKNRMLNRTEQNA